MEQFGREEGGLPGGEEPNPKRHKGDDPGTTSSKKDPDSKNVVVLKLGTDVFDRNGQVLMPNTIEMGQIKKPEKGQFKSNIKFTKEMTEMDVEGQLRRNFPILRDFSRFCCASAADQRSRLEFHDDSRQLWTGKLIKKRIRGNSALYILTEGTPEPGIASERSENPTAGCSVTDSPLVASKILKDLTRKVGQIPLHVQVVPGASQVGCLSTPLIHNPGGQPMLEDEQRVADTGSTQQSQRQNNAIVQGLRQEVQGKDPGRVETDLEDSAPSQMLGMTEEEFDSAFEEVMSKDSLLSESGGVKAIYPSSGPIEGEIGFCITLNQKLPKNETLDLTADFEGIEEVPLSIESRKTLTGVIPRSYREGTVTVTVKCRNGRRYGSTNFTYINNNIQAVLGEIVQVKNNQEAFFGALAEIIGLQETGGNGVQKTVPCGAIGTGSLNQNERSNAWSVKVLILLLYKAAQIDGREFLEMIFCTSAGKVVFNHYKNNAILPEDVARANGHVTLGNYLENVNKRFSKEGDSEDKNETIDWLELKHAVQKKHNLPSGSDDTQMLKNCQPASCLESDDNQSDYFADDETSICSSPSHSEMFDSAYKGQGCCSKEFVYERPWYDETQKGGYVKMFRGRIFLIGQDRSGKTSLKKNLVGLPFDPEEPSTDGIEVDPLTFKVKHCLSISQNNSELRECGKDIFQEVAEIAEDVPLKNYGKEKVDVEAEDEKVKEKGDRIYQSEITSPTSKAKGTVMCVNEFGRSLDIKSESTPNEPDVMISVTKHVHGDLKFPKGVLGKSSITKEKADVSIDLWDFGGQPVYYPIHPIFLSSRAVFVLVANLSKQLNAPANPCVRQGTHEIILNNQHHETNLENLLSWLVAVHSIRNVNRQTDGSGETTLPNQQNPVFIVGTHADEPAEDIAVMKKHIQAEIFGKEYSKHVAHPFFSIDNTRSQLGLGTSHITEQEGSTDGIQALRDRIMEILSENPCMQEKIPLRWLSFEKVIEALVAKHIYYIDQQHLQEYARREFFMEDADDFDSMISFYHSRGMIIKHRNTIVLEAQWLIDLFKQLITIPHFHKMDSVHSKYWQELSRNGILNMELADHIFSRFTRQGIIKEDILDLIERFGLIAKFSLSPTDVKYFVPAQLKSLPEDLCKMKPSPTDPCPLYLHFAHGFVPHGLFSQLVSRSIRWCAKTWPMEEPKLYQNGARFAVGEQTHDLILICEMEFIKIVLKQRSPRNPVSRSDTSAGLAVLVRAFVEETLQDLSEEFSYLSGLQYEFCVACPYCKQGSGEPDQPCLRHGRVSCTREDCFHLLEVKQDKLSICTRKVCNQEHTVSGLEKWLLESPIQNLSPAIVTGTSQGATVQTNPGKPDTTLNIIFICDEWKSSKGTLDREFAIQLAKHEKVEVIALFPEFSCSEEEKRSARNQRIAVGEVMTSRLCYEPLDWLSSLPRDRAIDIIVNQGEKLERQAQVIRESLRCQWMQLLHTFPEELVLHKNSIYKGLEKKRNEADLCKLADLTLPVGPKLMQAYSSYLRSCGKRQDIVQLTPGVFSEFLDVTQEQIESNRFKVLTFIRGDPEDFSLEGYDIAAKAIVELRDRSYRLIFVGAPVGKQEEVAENVLQSGISRDQLCVRKFVKSRERLKELFCEVDLCIMPSRTEGFGLTALKALSAGLPILVSGNSGLGAVLCALPLGRSFVVESTDPKEWANAIKAIRLKDRAERLEEVQQLRTCYEEHYSWEKQCEMLIQMMWRKVYEVKGGTPSDDELVELSTSIDNNWRALGRCLGVHESMLTAFDKENEQLIDKAYHMLMFWKQRGGGLAATYQVLYEALCHKEVRRKDLAEEFCCDRRACQLVSEEL